MIAKRLTACDERDYKRVKRMKGVFAVGFAVIACMQIFFAIAEKSGSRVNLNARVRSMLMRIFRRFRILFYLVDVVYVAAVLCIVFFTDLRTYLVANISKDTLESVHVAMRGVFGTNSFMVLFSIAIVGVTEAICIILASAILCCLVVTTVITVMVATQSAENDRNYSQKEDDCVKVEKLFLKHLRFNN